MLVIAGYGIGSLPAAWVLTRLVTGRDLRQMGSGNVGVMNTAVSVARWAGLIVFLIEAGKGILAVWLARLVANQPQPVGAAVLAAVVGTRWPIWLKGAGGRGNTTGMAAVFVISWPTVVSAIGFWLLARLLSGSSFLATRLNLLAWPLFFGLATNSLWYLALGAALSLLFLHAQRRASDDHLLLKEQWPSLWAFLTGPRRR
jgi:glycerol-3-phosphate acyltransferase PlsY